MKISNIDINKRIKTIGRKSTNIINMKEAQIYTDKDIFCENNAINSINNWESLGETTNEAFNTALNIFDEICKNSNKSIINQCCNILIEGISKVRDQTQLANSLKYRIARLKKNKTIKLTKQYNDVTSKIKNALTINPISINKSTTPTVGSSGGVVNECYEKIYEECIKNKECDRIINTYNNISKRFNLNKLINNVIQESDLYETCAIIAQYVDTYNSPFKNKYNTALEMAAYILDKNYMNYSKNNIVEAVTDYFIFSGTLKEKQYEDIKSVMEISVLFEQSDFSSLSWIIDTKSNKEEKYIDPYISESYGIDYNYLTEADLKKEIKKASKKLIKDAKEGNPEEHRDQEIKEMIDDFRKQCTKDPESKTFISGLKSLVYKIFTKSPYQIIYELPNLFSVFRVFFILSSAAITPIISIILYITDQILKLHLSRKQMEKVISAYKKEIDSVKSKIEKAKNEKSKDRLEKYLQELKKDLEKLEYKEKDLYTDDENDQRDEEKYASGDYNDDDFDFDFGDDEFGDLDFEEAASVILMNDMVSSIQEALLDTDIDGIVYNNIFKLSNDSIDSITDFSITVPVILEKDKLKESLINYRNQMRNSAQYTKDYIRIDCLNENIYKLNNSNYSYNTSNSNRDILNYLFCLKEIANIGSTEYITEMDFSNTIKLAINNLKKDVIKLSDKEKQASSAIDVAANNIQRKLEDAVKTNNREAVIKGSIIPSASKCIKIALTYGAAWCVSPAIAIISAIGHFACAKNMQKKERQLVLDDIDIELRMCERYMRLAEEKNDMKKIREIEKIQRNLIRQKQRIQYKMVTVYHQKVPNTIVKDD